MKTVSAFVFLLVAATVLSAADDKAAAKELKMLAGRWKIAAAEEGGKAVPKDELLPITFTVHPDGKSTVRVQDKEFETKSVVDPTKSPKTIDIEYLSGPLKGQKQYGIYKVEGNRWTVFSTAPGGKPEDRPSKFDSKTTKGWYAVWERVKEDKKP